MKKQKPDFMDAAKQPRTGVLRELWAFLASNKRWWLTPIIVSLILLGLLAALGSTAAAPFIYTIF